MLLNERDLNKRMMKIMSEGYKVSPSKSDVSEDQQQFRQNVASDTKFIEFSILPDAGNVIFKGSIPNVCEWVYEFNERNGPKILMANQIILTDEVMTILNKISSEFLNWREKWGTKLTEYQGMEN